MYDGVDEIDALGPLEVLRSAAAFGADITARLVTHDDRAVVTGAFGLRFEPDAVYVPGAADITIADRRRVGHAQRRRGVGRGATRRLAAAARRDPPPRPHPRRRVHRHAAARPRRRRRPPPGRHPPPARTRPRGHRRHRVHDRVVDDGDLVTSGGVTSGLDLALHLVAREVSPDIARLVAERMEYPAPATSPCPRRRDRDRRASPSVKLRR